MSKHVERSEPLPPKATSPRNWHPWVLSLLLLATAGLLGAVVVCFLPADSTGTPAVRESARPVVPKVLADFRRLKNAPDPRADDLLAPAPALPTSPVSDVEAERLDAQLFLRQPFKVTQVRQEGAGGVPRYVVVAEGAVQTQEGVTVRTADGGTRPHSRALFNPDFIVELRGDKIFGVRVKVHEDPEKPSLTPEQFRRLFPPDPGQR